MRLVNWDCVLQTAISDDEIEYVSRKGKLWYLKYPIVGREGEFLTVATTRPETMLGDTGVAVHPDDPRFGALVGGKVLLPLVNREIPIIADEGLAVSKAFDMLPAEAYLPDGRTAADTATVRSVFIIGPDKKLKLSMTYPMSVGRNFAEVLRALDALQLTYNVPLATPANWAVGQDVIVALALNDQQAREQYGEIDIKLPYLRTTRAPH
jgi:hypothetical protein